MNLRIHGDNYGAELDRVSVTVGGVPCEALYLLSHTLLECCTHERQGGVVVVVDGQVSETEPYNIQEIVPVLVIDAITPDHGPSGMMSCHSL